MFAGSLGMIGVEKSAASCNWVFRASYSRRRSGICRFAYSDGDNFSGNPTNRGSASSLRFVPGAPSLAGSIGVAFVVGTAGAENGTLT